MIAATVMTSMLGLRVTMATSEDISVIDEVELTTSKAFDPEELYVTRVS